MPDTPPLFNDEIHWPEGLSEQVFLDQYWQKKPLLIRQAFPEFNTPLPADELAGLSLEPDVTGRIITQDDEGAYHLEDGPFDEDRFADLPSSNWSLLVTDVEKHLPEFVAFLQPFRFIADWRIDDLMISYAPDGASVGAHIDEYDVFLLQGSGVRQWSIDSDNTARHIMRTDGDLKILANFKASDTWNLVAGDMLYLPPKIAHHGVAVGDECTTWSIGFRAPLIPDMIARLAESISEKMEPQRYRDDALTPARRGEISNASIQRFKSIWTQATQLSDPDFADLLGCWLSESSATTLDTCVDNSPDTLSLQSNIVTLHKNAFSRFAWISSSTNSASLFADGESVKCSVWFAEVVCESVQCFEIELSELSESDSQAVHILVSMGSLSPAD